MDRDLRIETVERLITPVLENEGLELVDIELKREAIGLVLRIYVDTETGRISIDDLSRASQSISRVLDEADVLKQKYTLEVSSPGIDRPLTKPEHFKKFIGSKVKVKTVSPIGNRKQFKGTLVSAGDEGFTVEIDSESFEIQYDNLAKARLQVELEF